MEPAVVEQSSDPALVVARRLRLAIKALAATKELSVKELAAQSGLKYNTFREHLNGDSGGVRLGELVRIAPVLELTVEEIVRIAETGEGFPLPAECELFAVLEGGGRNEEQPTLPFRTLASVN